MLGAMVVIFYMFFIRPQQKKQKNQKNFITELNKGDKIVTMGGIHGKVTEVTDATLTLDIDRGTTPDACNDAMENCPVEAIGDDG